MERGPNSGRIDGPGGWLDEFSGLAGLEPEARALLADLRPAAAPAGRVLFTPGGPCDFFVLALSGAARVSIVGRNGRALVLYRVTPNDLCVQTTLCLLGGQPYGAEGVAETDMRLVLAPADRFARLMATSPVFRGFVFSQLGRRLNAVSALLEKVAFSSLDARLADALLERAGPDGRVAATHQRLAEDIGSAREAVTRRLSLFVEEGWLRMARGELVLLDRAALCEISGRDPA